MGKKCFVMALAVFALGFGTALRSNAGTDMIEPYRAPAPSYNYAPPPPPRPVFTFRSAGSFGVVVGPGYGYYGPRFGFYGSAGSTAATPIGAGSIITGTNQDLCGGGCASRDAGENDIRVLNGSPAQILF